MFGPRIGAPRTDVVSKTEVRTQADGFRAATGAPKALVKGLALVEAVSAAGEPVPLSDLVRASGLPRSTALRLLEALCDWQVLRLDRSLGYTLGPQLAVWGQQYLDGLDVRRQAEDLMHGLSAATRETCFLGVREHRQVLYVARVDGPQAVQPAARIGSRNPLHSTAIGKALLAFGSPQAEREYLDGPLVRRTPNTITDAARLADEIRVTRDRGYAIDDVENEDGVRCVAAPVRDHTGEVVAAMSVSAPAYRFARSDLPQLAPKVLAATAELSARIGHRPHATAREAQ